MSPFPLSYSRLSLYEKCPAQYKFRYIENIPTEKGKAAQRGTDLHASIEGFLEGHKTTIHKEVVSIKQTLVHVKKNNPFVEHKIAFNEDFKAVVPWKDPAAWFRMVLDSAYLYGDEAHVQEWKSGKVYDDHADQRKLYAVGALGEWGAMQEAIVVTHYIDQGKKVTLRVERGRRTILAGQYTQRINVLAREKHWAPRPGKYCYWCSYSRYKGGPCKVG